MLQNDKALPSSSQKQCVAFLLFIRWNIIQKLGYDFRKVDKIFKLDGQNISLICSNNVVIQISS